MPRRRRAAPVAVAEATIVLPRPGVAAALPPPPPAEAEHLDKPAVKLPPGTRHNRLNLERLKSRDNRLALTLEKCRMELRMDLVMYEKLIDLAEEYSVSTAEMARQCLRDGIRRYRDFNSAYADSPFRPVTPMQAFPEIVQQTARDRPTNGDYSPRAVHDRRAALTAEDLTAPLPEYDREVDDRNGAGLASMAQMAATRLGNFLPQSPPLKSAEGLSYDALAPIPEALDDGTLREPSLAGGGDE